VRIVDIDAHPPFQATYVAHAGEMTQKRFFEKLTLGGVNAAWSALLPPEGWLKNGDLCAELEQLNEGALLLSSRQPDQYFPAIWVHSKEIRFSCAQIEKYAARGVRMIECVDATERTAAICECAQANDMVVKLTHCKREEVETLARSFPKLKMLFAGQRNNGVTPWEAADMLAAYPNLYLNLSHVHWLYYYILYKAVLQYPVERVMFGSAYPESNLAYKRSAVEWELRDQPETVRAMILSGNALRLLGEWKEEKEDGKGN